MNGVRMGRAVNAARVACARVIIETVKGFRGSGLTQRAAVIAVTTAIAESTLINSTEARDHDSLGLFQQRPSMGWGTPAQITDPVYATEKFLTVMLSKYPNNRWMSGDIGAICQAVQRSKYPDAYAHEVHDAQLLVNALWEENDMDGNTYIKQASNVIIGTIPGGTINMPFNWWLSAIYAHIIGIESVVRATAHAVTTVDGVDDQAKAQVEAARKNLDDIKAALLTSPQSTSSSEQ